MAGNPSARHGSPRIPPPKRHLELQRLMSSEDQDDEKQPLIVDRPEEASAQEQDGTRTLEQVGQMVITLDEAVKNLHVLLQENADQFGLRTRRTPRQRPKIPKWVTNNLLILTFLWQILFVGTMSVIDLIDKKDNLYVFYTSVIFMAVIQLLHLILVMSTTVKLTKQVFHHTVTPMFMAQSYLSTILLFAGLYSVTYRIWPHHWKEMVEDNTAGENTLMVTLFIKMLFFSVSTGTLCGAAHVVPSTWYLYIIVGIQMVLSFVYFASILSITINPIPPKSKKSNNKPSFTLYGTGKRATTS